MLCSTASSARSCRSSRTAVAASPCAPRNHVTTTSHARSVAVRYQPDQDSKAPWLNLPTEANYSVAEKNAVLTRAEDELGEYCNRLTDPTKAAECWSTYQFLKNKHISSLRGCAKEVQAGAPSAACANLEQLDQMIRELEAGGQIESLYHVLSLMKRMEAAAVKDAVDARAQRMCKWDPEHARLHSDAVKLFESVDADGDGRIDVAEFRAAMAKISPKDLPLSGDEVAQICECLDIHGFIEREQFVDIVAAERPRLQNPESDAEFLRHVTHRHGRGGIHLSDSIWQ